MRRKARLKERLTPCEACGYPVSQRHHLMDFAGHGENNETCPLCANCHEIYHLIVNCSAGEHENAKASKSLLAALAKGVPERVQVVRKIRSRFMLNQVIGAKENHE